MSKQSPISNIDSISDKLFEQKKNWFARYRLQAAVPSGKTAFLFKAGNGETFQRHLFASVSAIFWA